MSSPCCAKPHADPAACSPPLQPAALRCVVACLALRSCRPNFKPCSPLELAAGSTPTWWRFQWVCWWAAPRCRYGLRCGGTCCLLPRTAMQPSRQAAVVRQRRRAQRVRQQHRSRCSRHQQMAAAHRQMSPEQFSMPLHDFYPCFDTLLPRACKCPAVGLSQAGLCADAGQAAGRQAGSWAFQILFLNCLARRNGCLLRLLLGDALQLLLLKC